MQMDFVSATPVLTCNGVIALGLISGKVNFITGNYVLFYFGNAV